MSNQDPVYERPDDAPAPAPSGALPPDALDDDTQEMSAREMRAAARAALAGPDHDVTLSERLPVLLEQYRKGLLGFFALLAVLAIGAVLFFGWRKSQTEAEKTRMAASERLYEQALALPPGQTEQRNQLFQQALTSQGTRTGLKNAADKGDLIGTFYTASIYFELGQYDQAKTYFGKIGNGHGYVSASARAGEAAILENQNKPAEAAAKYLEAADLDDAKALAPQYLLSAARAFATAKKSTEAVEALDRLERDFPQAPELQNAGLIRGMAQAGS